MSVYIIHATFSQRDTTYDNVPTDNVHYIDVYHNTTDETRIKIIEEAKNIASSQKKNVIIRTGIMTDEDHSPCGCTGYDDVCWDCQYNEVDVKECFCSTKYNTKCEYHK